MLDRIDATDANDPGMGVARSRARSLRRARDAKAQRLRRVEALAAPGIGVKDIIATADLPTTMGSPIYAGAPSGRLTPNAWRGSTVRAV